ncbi:site-specific DNA-methyltransferase [Candidatus Pacearchaeota archaeon]|nr:site-specific DNA-methyltransferase [Candidatus Pacearchaeota archaeon]
MVEILHIKNMDYMATQPDKSFDLAIVDPPYFNGPNKLGYYGERVSSVGVCRPAYEKTKDWDIPGQEYFDELIRVSKHQIIWGINYYNIKNIGPGRIVWDKCNGASSFSDCEIAYTSCHDSVRMFAFMWNGMMQGRSIHDGRIQQGNKKLNEKRIHPTQKPIKLNEHFFTSGVDRFDRETKQVAMF